VILRLTVCAVKESNLQPTLSYRSKRVGIRAVSPSERRAQSPASPRKASESHHGSDKKTTTGFSS
jgi:hypothetical protein